jgi:uncharacterized protein (DUF1330 family)
MMVPPLVDGLGRASAGQAEVEKSLGTKLLFEAENSHISCGANSKTQHISHRKLRAPQMRVGVSCALEALLGNHVQRCNDRLAIIVSATRRATTLPLTSVLASSLRCHVRQQQGGNTMKTKYTVALSMLAGAMLGAAAIQGLHAQTKPPIYYVAEIDTANLDAYTKDYAPLAQASIKAAGGRILAGGQAKAVEGEPPKAARVVIQVWDNEEQIQKWRSSADYKKAREIGDKLAKFRSYSLAGVAQ